MHGPDEPEYDLHDASNIWQKALAFVLETFDKLPELPGILVDSDRRLVHFRLPVKGDVRGELLGNETWRAFIVLSYSIDEEGKVTFEVFARGTGMGGVPVRYFIIVVLVVTAEAGACCIFADTCSNLNEADCVASNGVFVPCGACFGNECEGGLVPHNDCLILGSCSNMPGGACTDGVSRIWCEQKLHGVWNEEWTCRGCDCCSDHVASPLSPSVLLPGCGRDACRIAVCAFDPYCCDTDWDATCAGWAINDLCSSLCACSAIFSDCSIDVPDLLALLAEWGQAANGFPDLNGDGVVNVPDLLTLLSAWGPCP